MQGSGFAQGSLMVKVNAIRNSKHRKTCASSVESTGMNVSSNGVVTWQQNLRLTLGGSGYVTLNVFSQNMFSANTFLGQVSIDLDAHREIYAGKNHELTMKLRHDELPVFNKIGAAVSVDANRASILTGDITFSVTVPDIKKNLCGWWWEIKSTFLGTVSGEKIWVVVHRGIVYCYEGPFEGRLLKQFDVCDIVDMRAPDYNQSTNDDMDAVSIILKDGKKFDWAWFEDQIENKGLWKQALGVYNIDVTKA